MQEWPLQRECDEFYGNPRGGAGKASSSWEHANLTRIKPPFQMYYDGKPIKTIQIHRKCAPSLKRVLDKIWVASGKNQKIVDSWGASVFAGSYVFRQKRGGTTLSMHSWACALDLDPARNGFRNQRPNFGRGDANKVVQAFESEGWEWGGRWSGRSCDGMHFQASWTRPDAVTPRSGPTPVSPIWPSPTTPGDKTTPTTPDDLSVDVAAIQRRLTELNYATGGADGVIGPLTRSAIRDLQDANNLVVSGKLDRATIALIEDENTPPRPVSAERAALTAARLRDSGSKIVEAADESKFGAAGAALATAAGVAAEAKEVVAQVEEIKTGIESGVSAAEIVRDYWPAILIVIAAIAAGYFLWRAYRGAKKVETERVENARKGINVRI